MTTLNLDVVGRDKGALSLLRNLSKESTKTATSVEKVSKATSGFGSLTGLAFKAAGVAAVGYGLKVASANEQAKVSFTTMLGSAQKADVFLKQLQSFAATTPFEFPELQTAAQSLISAGIQANKVIPIMRTLGDVTAGMGTGSEGIKRATVAIQQMNAAGRITAEDLNQLRDAGIPVYDLLAAATKKSTAEVTAMASAGKLGRKELEQLMTALESGKGLEKFNGLMAEQSKTLAGMVSTLKDVSGQMLAGWLEPLFPALKASIGAFSDMSSEAKTTFAVIAGGTAVMAITAKGAYSLAKAFEALGLSAKVAKGAVGGVGAVLGIAAIAFGIYASEHAKAKAQVEDFTTALQGETDALDANVRAVAAKQLKDQGALKAADTLGLSLADVTDAVLGQNGALERIQPLLDAYVAAGVDGSVADQDRASAAGQLSDAIKDVGGAHNKAVGDARQMESATKASTEALGGQEKKAIDAKNALKQWRTEVHKAGQDASDLEASADNVQAAIDDVTQSVKDNGKSLDNNTEKGRNNRESLRNLAKASRDHIDKLVEQGKKTGTVNRATDEAREAFVKAAIEITNNRKEAEKLADKYGLVDRKVNALNDKKITIKFGAGSYSIGGVKYSVNLTSPSSVGRSAAGGPVHGPGTGTSDSIPMMLSDGEFVVNAKATAKHRALLEQINAASLTGRAFRHDAAPTGMRAGGVVTFDNQGPGGAVHAASQAAKYRDAIAQAIGKDIGARAAKKIAAWQNTMGGGGGVGTIPAGPGWGPVYAAARRAGARSFTTYAGHDQGASRSRDIWPPSWAVANAIRRLQSVWYTIYSRRIASVTRANRAWLPYHGSNPHTDHVHVTLRPGFNKGGEVKNNLAKAGVPPNLVRVSSGGHGGGPGGKMGGDTYIINAPNYVGSQSDLRKTLVDMSRRGELKVLNR